MSYAIWRFRRTRSKPHMILCLGLLVFIIYTFYKIVMPEWDSFQELEMADMSEKQEGSEIGGNNASKIKIIDELIQKYRLDWNNQLNDMPWHRARGWMSDKHVHPEDTPELGSVLRAMSTWKITKADLGFRGTQLKMTLIIQGGQKALFKPKWCSRDHVVEGEPYAGMDRHNGEIAAFHLGRLLEFRRTPLAVGRVLNLEEEIKPVAQPKLLATFFKRGDNTCFYGKCYYCMGEETGLCGDGAEMEGTVVLWLPKSVEMKQYKHPWSRTYQAGVQAQWETNENYCIAMQKIQRYNEGPRLLDIIDTAVLDYLIGNADRHHYETESEDESAILLILDNAKSFGNPHVDEKSILAPLYQCCRIRESTWLQLQIYEDGILSQVLESVLSVDPISPVLNNLHLKAMDRRLSTIIDTVRTCIDQYSDKEVLITDR